MCPYWFWKQVSLWHGKAGFAPQGAGGMTWACPLPVAVQRRAVCGNAVGARWCEEEEGQRGHGARWPQWLVTNSPGLQQQALWMCFLCRIEELERNQQALGGEDEDSFLHLSLHSSIYRFGGLQCFGYSAEQPLAATLRLNPKAKAL